MHELVSALIGALAGAVAAALLYTREARRALKVDALRRYVANRFHTTGEEFTRVLNEIPVVFADAPSVVLAVRELARGANDQKLVALYRAMADAAGIRHKSVPDELFLTAFNVREQ